jgi:hypothetical protein
MFATGIEATGIENEGRNIRDMRKTLERIKAVADAPEGNGPTG